MKVFRMGGFTDQITECELCGKPELRGTIQMIELDEDGNDFTDHYFGTTCAAKASGWTQKKVKDEALRVTAAKRIEDEERAFRAWKLDHYGTEDTGVIMKLTGWRYTEIRREAMAEYRRCLP
ncbi:hypothetical protein ACWDTQ_28320 [Streptomyces cellulosae]